LTFSVTTYADEDTVDSGVFEKADILEPRSLGIQYSLSESEAGHYPTELEIMFNLASFTP